MRASLSPPKISFIYSFQRKLTPLLCQMEQANLRRVRGTRIYYAICEFHNLYVCIKNVGRKKEWIILVIKFNLLKVYIFGYILCIESVTYDFKLENDFFWPG